MLGLFRKKERKPSKKGDIDLVAVKKSMEDIQIRQGDAEKLAKSRVFVVGCGALGISASLHLAATGVGTIGLVDSAYVTQEDVDSHPIYGSQDNGKRRSIFLADKLREINPVVNATPSTSRLRYDTAAQVTKTYDVIMDCSNDTPTGYLVSDMCVISGKTDIYSFVHGHKGKITVLDARYGPCHRCAHPRPVIPPQAESKLSMLDITGAEAAKQAIKTILGMDGCLIGKVMVFEDGHEAREKDFPKREDCEACGTGQIKALIDYEKWCGVKNAPVSASATLDQEKKPGSTQNNLEISPREVKDMIDRGDEVMLFDVREKWENDTAKIEGSNLIPLGHLAAAVKNLPKDAFIVAYCHTGNRSLVAAEMLCEKGLSARSMHGGIAEWSRDIDSKVPTY